MLTDRPTEELLEKKEEALDRLRKNFYHLWKTLKEAREDPTLPGRWSRAPGRLPGVAQGEAARAGS
jgi:hypothetical protein